MYLEYSLLSKGTFSVIGGYPIADDVKVGKMGAGKKRPKVKPPCAPARGILAFSGKMLMGAHFTGVNKK